MPRKTYYGIIGNGETCALISPVGSIDWLCLPRFDGKIIFDKILDRKGKSFNIEFYSANKKLAVKPLKQEYINRTNILKTTLSTTKGRIEITDFMPWKKRMIIRMVKSNIKGLK